MDPLVTAFFLLAESHPESAFAQLEGGILMLCWVTDASEEASSYRVATRAGQAPDRAPVAATLYRSDFSAPGYVIAEYGHGVRAVIHRESGGGIVQRQVGTMTEYQVVTFA